MIIPARASVRIQVRFPILEPGYLIDVIGLRRDGALEALIPATSQPAYRADQVPRADPGQRARAQRDQRFRHLA